MIPMPLRCVAELIKVNIQDCFPETVKCVCSIHGQQGREKEVLRFELTNGCICEAETTKMKHTDDKFVWKQKVLKTNCKYLEGYEGDIEYVYKLTALTYCGCPMKQAIMDRQSLKYQDTSISQCCTLVTWKSNFSGEMT